MFHAAISLVLRTPKTISSAQSRKSHLAELHAWNSLETNSEQISPFASIDMQRAEPAICDIFSLVLGVTESFTVSTALTSLNSASSAGFAGSSGHGCEQRYVPEQPDGPMTTSGLRFLQRDWTNGLLLELCKKVKRVPPKTTRKRIRFNVDPGSQLQNSQSSLVIPVACKVARLYLCAPVALMTHEGRESRTQR